MRAELKRIQLEWGVTTIYVTHDQAEAMAISDRIAVLDHGLMVQLGTPDEIYELPRSEFVANFIGRTNMFRGQCINVAEAGSMGTVRSEIGDVRCHFPAKLGAGENVSFVVRPENIQLRDVNGGPAGDNVVEGKITNRVYLGEIAEYSIDLDGKFQLLVRAPPGNGAKAGDRVRAYLPPEKTIAIFS